MIGLASSEYIGIWANKKGPLNSLTNRAEQGSYHTISLPVRLVYWALCELHMNQMTHEDDKLICLLTMISTIIHSIIAKSDVQ